MTLGAVLAGVRERLRTAGADEAPLEAEVLVMAAAGISRARLYASLREPPPPGFHERLDSMLVRRLDREPLAYILGRREFYGLDFEVTPAVLVPRQETEALVDLVINLAREHFGGEAVIVDVGTGSGAVSVSAALALPKSRVIATDISPAALAVAASNASRLGAAGGIEFRRGDLLDAAPLTPEEAQGAIVAANLPYVTDEEMEFLAPEVRREPRLALSGGSDGLDLVRRLLAQIERMAAPPRFAALELGDGQTDRLLRETRDVPAPTRAKAYADLSGAERGALLEFTPAPASAGLAPAGLGV